MDEIRTTTDSIEELNAPGIAGCAGGKEGPEAALADQPLAGRVAEFGINERDRMICSAIYWGELSEEYVARQHGLSPRTVRNVARTVMKRLAKQRAQWNAMTLEELSGEERRLTGLFDQAMDAWKDSQQPLKTTRTVETRRGPVTTWRTVRRCGTPRFLQIAARLAGELRQIGNAVAVRRAFAAAQREADLEADTRRRVRTVPRRTRRRKSLGGKRLCLPLFVRKASIARSVAKVAGRLGMLPVGLWRIGIPPPGHARTVAAGLRGRV